MARHARRGVRGTGSERWHACRLSGAEVGVSVCSLAILAGAFYVSASGQGVQQQFVAKSSLDEIVSEHVADGGSLEDNEKLPEALRGMLATAEPPRVSPEIPREADIRSDARSLQPLPTVTSTVTVTATPDRSAPQQTSASAAKAAIPTSESTPVAPVADDQPGVNPGKESTPAPIITPAPTQPSSEPSDTSGPETPEPSDSHSPDHDETGSRGDNDLAPSPSPGATGVPPSASGVGGGASAPVTDELGANAAQERKSSSRVTPGTQGGMVIPVDKSLSAR